MTNEILYEDRVVFYFDILGFKNLVESNINNGNDCSSIFDVFELINKFYQDEIDERFSATKEITFFSDSIIISFVANEPDQIFKTISDIQILLVNLVLKGIVMRGAISYGKLHHSKKYIFGPAFNKVYKLETQIAIYPRIICDYSILDLSQKDETLISVLQNLEIFKEIVKQDSYDKYMYIDYFKNLESIFDEGYNYVEYLLALRNLIIDNIEKSYCDRIKEKYIWMKEKFNEAVKNIVSNNYLEFVITLN